LQRKPVVIIGAGPAGLTAAYELTGKGVACTVLEMDSIVGGLARTEEYRGYRFDMGGHRFHTKVQVVDRMWREVLGADFLKRRRLSRVYYGDRYFRYPLEPLDALRGLGLLEALHCAASYLKACVFPRRQEENLEDWLTNRFGARLYQLFFRTYTEKVWGIPCNRIGAEWGAQRIRGLSIGALVREWLRPWSRARPRGKLTTLIQEFDYPREGPGMMWTRTAEIVQRQGGRLVMQAPVSRVEWKPGAVERVQAGPEWYEGTHFLSSMPIRELISAMTPAPPQEVREAADRLRYRDFLTVALMMRGPNLFPDNWIYVHSPEVRVGRIQNYGNWSADMLPDPDAVCLGMEYFCFENDSLWNTPDTDLIRLATQELGRLKLVEPGRVMDGTVRRIRKAYPVYDDSCQQALAVIRRFLEGLPNLQLVGRNGMHRYNNQDHSMLTAMLAARNILGSNYDLWRVNTEMEYLEEGFLITEAELAAFEHSQPQAPFQAR